ncbi:hypothetical protein COW36_04655 [bacterium (Candidatus Blackallbacteria) CG17_big_fil_post_rev_8_21_14_2_50_48_46]|uniref:DUF192 domain-containing protein n=1 Tax=bacterium (Candidatus Blackallbacteria) CG17_big_fil_post_rev_8_21_14_2_50_48_46 TaxID=2014261 RepID=A0A2M7G914_9BACT|nr:MAG: hypothetical protein COW64_04290 [bacterium (Candidatus Blackallbacteria) CG18_big_fil_WC_8_21_14_2_50_49_26]PIW18585.1 MAG: hypothetical protein COW36_04655 [bacterium (Candidatus Blackallbacteria) CG17_big_fil_post_rev_8_21_14_2_50_48_46]PIW46429.1 MAG: hypothetical protein COW20_16025 [bacterium (Candidatus Blackallbacteria) CG13_big_fil_rev_8_21_14_2_50_49_14]
MAKPTLCAWRGEQKVLENVILANHFFSRLKGLLGRKSIAPDQGLLIRPCHSVHTMGMKFSIGVVFLDKDGKILHLILDMAPGRFSPVIKGARQVLELQPERLQSLNLNIGEYLRFAL